MHEYHLCEFVTLMNSGVSMLKINSFLTALALGALLVHVPSQADCLDKENTPWCASRADNKSCTRDPIAHTEERCYWYYPKLYIYKGNKDPLILQSDGIWPPTFARCRTNQKCWAYMYDEAKCKTNIRNCLWLQPGGDLDDNF